MTMNVLKNREQTGNSLLAPMKLQDKVNMSLYRRSKFRKEEKSRLRKPHGAKHLRVIANKRLFTDVVRPKPLASQSSYGYR